MPHTSAPRPHSTGSPGHSHGHSHGHFAAARQSALSECSPRHSHHEWQAKEELRTQELEEAKARASQMEKTMRWWSDCTANWREKWSKVRAERNKAREELRSVRLRLETALKETAAVKRDRHEIEAENESLAAELGQLKRLLSQRCECGGPLAVGAPPDPLTERAAAAFGLPEFRVSEAERGAIPKQRPRPVMEPESVSAAAVVPPGMVVGAPVLTPTPVAVQTPVPAVSPAVSPAAPASPTSPVATVETASVRQRDATDKALQLERDEKAALQRTVESLRQDVSDLRSRLDDVRLSRQETLKQLMELRAQHENQLTSMQLDLRDETSSREVRDLQLAELRSELERLQAENAAEWERRERLETDKISVERDNKKLRAHIADLEERLEKRSRQLSQTAETENKQLQSEVFEKSRELSELKHAHSKLKKVLQEKTTELSHAMRRAEQFEAEVRRLRGRVDELKRELGTVEDEVDSSTTNQRRLVRTNEELQEQVESLSVQLQHLQARARAGSSAMPSIKDKILVDGETDDEELGEL
ncbi:Coiled-coil domain-containing protein 102A [Amphibalanus amphitrite]|uniref:Coiled-coil domain-containing protein 102A n=1 Tax=Amphibalanus amphitrite TaxID=1232801 RepID=A0A6A4WU15_AMPAM|nr:coiled-coil domain-containing protein 102A-like [Amphibalanus amphitrite]XP_043199495.1 coiled-coil domain-containing protein 102A-like [Amphibalanus amphitrite]XP_043199496.1 coiled-coil domain-containing protein 102A-like [Amphibalanus amphitrite]XP_043234675.1 coiled-coil domain-containing protein 102A-like [Amphibalanus amphitrite]XP_043234676.1 coiled-coil domain-containing protein 102A-like [Amphibalanus amphitrite]KAF0310647.1 Coiled-coil domain-containing protein 102A [Amphibalanus 